MSRVVGLLIAGLLALTAGCGDDPAMEAPDDGAEDADDTADGDGDGYTLGDQPDEAAASFVVPEAGETVSSPVAFEFDVEGVKLAEAGDPTVGEAHVHVLVDRGCVDAGEAIPGPGEDAEADGIFHFGDGSAKGELDLEPGEHELCLQLADGAHQAFGATDEIIVTVE